MKTTDTLAAPPPDASQRVLPDSARYRWEQQWLRENRAAVRVIANTASGSTTTDAPPLAPAPVLPRTAAPAAASMPAAAAAGADPSRQPAAPVSAEAVLALYRSGSDSTPTLAGPMPAPHRPTSPASAAEATASAAPPRPAAPLNAGPPKRFGLWLENDRVTLSLRTADERAQPPELDALRRWLRGLRLTLHQVIVNGVALWRRPPDAD